MFLSPFTQWKVFVVFLWLFLCCPILFSSHLINSFTVWIILIWQPQFGRIMQKSKFLEDERRKGSITFRSMRALHFLKDAFISFLWKSGLLFFVRVWVSAMFWTDVTQPGMFVHPAFELRRTKGLRGDVWAGCQVCLLTMIYERLRGGATPGCGNAVRLRKLL